MNDFLSFVANILNVDVAEINMDTTFNSIPEWDSIMQLRLVMEIEDHYNVQIPFDETENIHSLGDFYQYIEVIV